MRLILILSSVNTSVARQPLRYTTSHS